MGIIYVELLLSNPTQPTLKPIKVTAIVDTGAITLCIPEHIAIQLKLEETEQREVTTANTKSHLVPYMGPIKINFFRSYLLYWCPRFRRHRFNRIHPVRRYGFSRFTQGKYCNR